MDGHELRRQLEARRRDDDQCGSHKPTRFGFDAWCSKPPGHEDTEHTSADFRWTDDMETAVLKGAT